MKAYHFLTADMTTGYGRLRKPWAVGQTRRVTGPIELCERGYHSSPTPIAALEYAPGPMLCLVDVSQPVAVDDDKQVSRRRTLVQAVDATETLHRVACDIAEDVLPIFEEQYPNDDRPRRAIEAKRLWLAGVVDDGELDAARAAAEAAWDAARPAAEAATHAPHGKYRDWTNQALLDCLAGAG